MLSSIIPIQQPKNRLRIWLMLTAALSLAALAVMSLRGGQMPAQGMPALIGRIEGDDLEVVTTTPSGVQTNAAPTVVASGSEVTLHSGHALLMLNSGGTVSICGPARFKMVKSDGAITLALDYGRVHPELDSPNLFTIYTPTIIATPISIAGASRDLTVGLEEGGEMCVLTKLGAMRVEPQFSDQSMIIPQGGVATLSGGQIESLSGNPFGCACDFPRAGLQRARPSVPTQEISTLSRPLIPEKSKIEPVAPATPPKEEPVYTVIMPPLSFDANSPTPPPDPDPDTILLVREVRVRSSAIYHGHVNPTPEQKSVAPAATQADTPAVPTPAENKAAPPQPRFLDRVRNFFRRLTGRGPCAGAGCDGSA